MVYDSNESVSEWKECNAHIADNMESVELTKPERLQTNRPVCGDFELKTTTGSKQDEWETKQ